MLHEFARWMLACTCLLATSTMAQTGTTSNGERLRSGTKVSAPFVVERRDGSLDGLSIELWKAIAEREGLEYEFVELDMDGILDGVASGDLDAGIAAISVTPAREEVIDFSHAYYMSGLGIAV
ncbi:MAG: transporter substrate-binding domain-containing protein, partial [Phycisphaerales bacterium]|nr:transporter substrate-binding domain-containing protein [Phycisphaerales bacterium]